MATKKRKGIYQFKVGDVVTSTINNLFLISFRGRVPNTESKGYKVTNLKSKATYYVSTTDAHKRWKLVNNSKAALALFAPDSDSDQEIHFYGD